MRSWTVKGAMGLALLLAAPIATPAWSAAKSSLHDKKCSASKHRHAKRIIPAKPERGVMIVEQRKDVQILSFGP